MQKNIAPRDSWLRIGPGQMVEIDDSIMQDLGRQTKALREIRGNVLALSIEIEMALDVVIGTLFFPPTLLDKESDKAKRYQNRSILFDSFVLKDKPMSFKHKIDLLEKLFNEHHLLIGMEFEKLQKGLIKIRDTRNNFAHYTIAFVLRGKEKTVVPVMTCGSKEIDLNRDYFDGLNVVYVETMKSLEELTRRLERVHNSLENYNSIGIVEEIRQLGLPLGQYVVVGSGIMEVLGIKKANDIDLVVIPELFDKLKETWENHPRTDGKPGLRKGNASAYLDVNSGEFNPTADELIKNAKVVDGIPFIGLEQLLKFKRAYGREKDTKDIELIDNYLRSQSQ